MTNKLYYWGENLESYSSDISEKSPHSIEIKKLNFFIGKNNSGKSRFLRNLFKNTKYTLKDYSFPELTEDFLELKVILDANRGNVYFSGESSSFTRNNISKLIEEVLNFPIYPKNKYMEICSRTLDQLLNVTIDNTNQFKEKVSYLIKYINDYQINFKNEKTNFYIPILRGMRPVTKNEDEQPYIERTQKDYFKNIETFNVNNIITGECLYHELKTHLLGEPEQRDLIRKYEEKLSQYFFDNDSITLIPKIGKDKDGREIDVVHIKIGNEKQFPISQLGDGLQQAIILTYEAFIKNKDENGNENTHLFFIEEPELHMHAGMVRQLMNFYLNETQHYYFFTTHSNHLLDMIDESDDVIIQKFIKQPKDNGSQGFDFKIYRCDKDHDLLTSLGVRPSSLYLANCTIWVEGVTDRIYLSTLMKKYIEELELSEDSYSLKNAKLYKSFMPNFHYAFIEYAGGNITHWSFYDEYSTKEDAKDYLSNNKGLTAKAITKNIFLLADGDNEGKADRLEEWKNQFNDENLYILPCKEIENILSKEIVYKACMIQFEGKNNLPAETLLNPNTIQNLKSRGFDNTKKTGFDINNLTLENLHLNSNEGIGKIIDDIIRIDAGETRLFSEMSGTIANKVKFCDICKVLMTYEDWKMSDQAKDLCQKVFNHIQKCNS
ncbi:AAA family ATPase [Acinetobacter bereziniae]|uniref:AAA family ATPase n=1 Tax=Acinetobacter bereziniae TaxID=106648 RepID=UPI0018FFA1F2|nr:AAA family ATPase [Acinetobacter bereziniae]MBJ8443863.1 ATP-binding protein [Acinetobacter bereziniae]